MRRGNPTRRRCRSAPRSSGAFPTRSRPSRRTHRRDRRQRARDLRRSRLGLRPSPRPSPHAAASRGEGRSEVEADAQAAFYVEPDRRDHVSSRRDLEEELEEAGLLNIRSRPTAPRDRGGRNRRCSLRSRSHVRRRRGASRAGPGRARCRTARGSRRSASPAVAAAIADDVAVRREAAVGEAVAVEPEPEVDRVRRRDPGLARRSRWARRGRRPSRTCGCNRPRSMW